MRIVPHAQLLLKVLDDPGQRLEQLLTPTMVTRAFDQSGKQMKIIGSDPSVKTQFRRFAQEFFGQGQGQNFGITEGRFRAGRVIRKNLAIKLVSVVHPDKNSREEGFGIEHDGSSMNHKPICDNGLFDTKSSFLMQEYVQNN